jgi:hypothetical protein
LIEKFARHTVSTFCDILSNRKDELADMQNSLYGDACILRDKMIYALRVESSVGNDYSNFPNADG